MWTSFGMGRKPQTTPPQDSPARIRSDALADAPHLVHGFCGNGLLAGVSVLTLDGALPVEYLAPGDRIITRDSGTAVLQAVRRARRHLPRVHIQAGTLGHMRPNSDLTLPASQQILIRDWRAKALFGRSSALIPAKRLIDGTFIRDDGSAACEMIELIFDAPHILYVDGLELASSAPLAARPEPQRQPHQM
jgi:hypothetical protein